MRLTINRAPVLTLWAAVVARRLGFAWGEALTLGQAVAGLNAQSKGRRLGIFHPSEKGAQAQRKAWKPGQVIHVDLLGRAVPATRTPEGLRALSRTRVTSPESVTRYLESRLGEALPVVRAAMTALARSLDKAELAERGFALYERFRPAIPAGVGGWGAKGVLDLERIRRMAASGSSRSGSKPSS